MAASDERDSFANGSTASTASVTSRHSCPIPPTEVGGLLVREPRTSVRGVAPLIADYLNCGLPTGRQG